MASAEILEDLGSAWQRLRGELLRCAPRLDAEDLVQDALLRLVDKGVDPREVDSIRLGRFILRCSRLDRLRKQRLVRFEAIDADVEDVLPKPSVPRPWPTDLARQLGRAAIQLCELLSSGIRSNAELARQLGTDPRAIARRRTRIRRVLTAFLDEGLDQART